MSEPIAKKGDKRYIGYCPLYRECYHFAVDDSNNVICFIEDGHVGNTCEHLIVTLREDLAMLRTMSIEELVECYGQIFWNGLVEKA